MTAAGKPRVLDLDQLRAEANQEPFEVRVGGMTFDLPAVLPVSLSLSVNQLASGDDLNAEVAERIFRTIITGLVGDRADDLMRVISMEELQHVVVACYGVSVGESSASDASSSNGGTPPRPTASATTAGS